jgi:hypothetical protein
VGTGGISSHADHSKGAGDGPGITTWDEDNRDEWAVLRQALELHPTSLTQDELIRELNGGRPRAFSELDRVERAIRELARAGLLHRPGEDEMVTPTPLGSSLLRVERGGVLKWRARSEPASARRSPKSAERA